MKNKKVIILTRDVKNTYSEDCNAYKQFNCQVKEKKNYAGEHIKNYILQLIEDICTNDKDKDKHELRWNAINKKNKFLAYSKRLKFKRDEFPLTGKPAEEYFKWLFETKIKTEVNNALDEKENEEIDNKPYVNFVYKCKDTYACGSIEEYDVYFVFLNRIFDTFVDGSEEYYILINDKNRLKFIEAICQDCNIDIENKNLTLEDKAIFYIHDKEWYKSDEPFAVLLNGEEVPGQKIYADELKNYFSTIKVFLHTPNHIFNEIEELNFTEEDYEVKLMKRGFF